MNMKTKEPDIVNDIFIIVISILFLIAGLALTIFPQQWSGIVKLHANDISIIGVCCSITALVILVATKD